LRPQGKLVPRFHTVLKDPHHTMQLNIWVGWHTSKSLPLEVFRYHQKSSCLETAWNFVSPVSVRYWQEPRCTMMSNNAYEQVHTIWILKSTQAPPPISRTPGKTAIPLSLKYWCSPDIDIVVDLQFSSSFSKVCFLVPRKPPED